MLGAEREVRVAYRDRRWEVSVDGHSRRMADVASTKEGAVLHAIELAHLVADREGIEVEVVIDTQTALSTFAYDDVPQSGSFGIAEPARQTA